MFFCLIFIGFLFFHLVFAQLDYIPNIQVSTFIGNGQANADGARINTTIYYPSSICVDSTDTYLYITDRGSNSVRQVNLAENRMIKIGSSELILVI